MFQEQYLRDTQFINLYYYYEFNNLVLFIIIDTATHDHYILHSHCSALVFGNSVNFRGIWALRLAWAKSSCRTHLSSVWQTRATGVISITGVCISSATLEWVWYMSLRLRCRFRSIPFLNVLFAYCCCWGTISLQLQHSYFTWIGLKLIFQLSNIYAKL